MQSPLSLNDLVEVLKEFPPETIKTLTDQAKERRAEMKRSSIPPGEIERLKALYMALKDGRTVKYTVRLGIDVTATFKAEYEYGHLSDFKVELSGYPMSDFEKKLFELMKEGLHDIYLNDSCTLENIIPGSQELCEVESENYTSFRDARITFEETYGVDPWPFLDEK